MTSIANQLMSTQSIQSQDIKISEVFQGFYSVPDYQREYVWIRPPPEHAGIAIRWIAVEDML
jgi:hypothetical protein